MAQAGLKAMHEESFLVHECFLVRLVCLTASPDVNNRSVTRTANQVLHLELPLLLFKRCIRIFAVVWAASFFVQKVEALSLVSFQTSSLPA